MNEVRTRLDNAIDRAVRDFMRRDPPAGLRGRVVARLHAPARPAIPWSRFATAAAVVAAIGVAVLVVRNPTSVPSIEPQPVAANRGAVRAVQPVAESGRQTGGSPGHRPPATARPEPVRSATFGPRDGRIGAANLRTATAGVPDAPAEPIVGDALVPSPPAVAVGALTPPNPIEIAPIVVAPIQIPRIQLEPVQPPR